MSTIPSRSDFLFTESFDNLMNSNISMSGGRKEPSPGDALHQEALEYLKTTLKLKELEARAYKSIAYRHVKETNPEAKHFERAEKMLELVKSKNFVKEYKDKLADTMKILEDIDAEKAKRNSESASQVSTEEKVSRRISKKRKSKQNGGSTFSETSEMNNYTESNSNKPYYNEYMQAKNQYLQAKLKQNGGSTFSETSVMNNYTESNSNKPYYNEYMQAKNEYLQAKLKQNSGSTFSETSVMNNYTESNSNKPYYNEYMQAKNQYLQAKLKQNGGLSVPSRDSFLLTESFDNLMNNSK
jgi:ubiquitin